MVLQLSLFQIFFMALSIVGLSFSILYLFIGGYNYDSSAEAYSERNQDRRDERKTSYRPKESSRPDRDNVFDISSGRRRETKPQPVERTSVGRQPQRVAQPSMRVLEVDYKVVHNRSTVWDEVTIDQTISITGRASGTGRW